MGHFFMGPLQFANQIRFEVPDLKGLLASGGAVIPPEQPFRQVVVLLILLVHGALERQLPDLFLLAASFSLLLVVPLNLAVIRGYFIPFLLLPDLAIVVRALLSMVASQAARFIHPGLLLTLGRPLLSLRTTRSELVRNKRAILPLTLVLSLPGAMIDDVTIHTPESLGDMSLELLL